MDAQAREVPVTGQTTALSPLRVVYTDSASVRVWLISRPRFRLAAIGGYVGTDQSGGKVVCSDSTPNSDTPSAHGARWQHDLAALAPAGTSQYPRHQLKAQLAPAQ